MKRTFKVFFPLQLSVHKKHTFCLVQPSLRGLKWRVWPWRRRGRETCVFVSNCPGDWEGEQNGEWKRERERALGDTLVPMTTGPRGTELHLQLNTRKLGHFALCASPLILVPEISTSFLILRRLIIFSGAGLQVVNRAAIDHKESRTYDGTMKSRLV